MWHDRWLEEIVMVCHNYNFSICKKDFFFPVELLVFYLATCVIFLKKHCRGRLSQWALYIKISLKTCVSNSIYSLNAFAELLYGFTIDLKLSYLGIL